MHTHIDIHMIAVEFFFFNLELVKLLPLHHFYEFDGANITGIVKKVFTSSLFRLLVPFKAAPTPLILIFVKKYMAFKHYILNQASTYKARLFMP